jgi:hypothetical protein
MTESTKEAFATLYGEGKRKRRRQRYRAWIGFTASFTAITIATMSVVTYSASANVDPHEEPPVSVTPGWFLIQEEIQREVEETAGEVIETIEVAEAEEARDEKATEEEIQQAYYEEYAKLESLYTDHLYDSYDYDMYKDYVYDTHEYNIYEYEFGRGNYEHYNNYEYNSYAEPPEAPVESMETPMETIELLREPVVAARSNFKSWMDWRMITSRSSRQWRLQQIAYTCADGFRRVDGMYMIALGTYFLHYGVGDVFDITLSSDLVFRAVVGDVKSDAHTDYSNRFHLSDGSILEFIVDRSYMPEQARRMGDMSYGGFPGEIISIVHIPDLFIEV